MLDQIRLTDLDAVGNGLHLMPAPYHQMLLGVTPEGNTAVASVEAVRAIQDVGEPIEDAFWRLVEWLAEIETPEALSVRGWAGTRPEAA